MHTKQDIIQHLEEIGVNPKGTLFVHSSLKSIGELENGAETVIEAFCEYMSDGLLIFPTHTWEQMNNAYLVFDPETEPSCVGVLSNLFMKRRGVIRSLHPTHSVAALGKEAEAFVEGEQNVETPCARNGCYGKLYDRHAQIMFLGCSLKCNTFLHGVEEWNNIPYRITSYYVPFKIKMPDGEMFERPSRRHGEYGSYKGISDNYDKMEPAFLEYCILKTGKVGGAHVYLCKAKEMADLVSEYLAIEPQLFGDDMPLPEAWYKK